jgi:hypothetical protein
MPTPTMQTLAAATLAAMLWGAPAFLFGSEPESTGLSRVTDSSPSAAFSSHSAYGLTARGAAAHASNTSIADCPSCQLHGLGPQSGYGLWGHRKGLRQKKWHKGVPPWLLCNGYCTYSPGHGWSPPIHQPIPRVPVEYQRFWPTTWYGDPRPPRPIPLYPTVYMPTDTTQLGFYYQYVPQWRPIPGMLPAFNPQAIQAHAGAPGFGGPGVYGPGGVISPLGIDNGTSDGPPPTSLPPAPEPDGINTSAGNWQLQSVGY